MAAFDEAAYKKAKIAAAMGRTQLAKAEKAFGDEPTPEQRTQLEELRGVVTQAEAELDRLQGAQAAAAPTPGMAALKQAKVALVSRRAELRSAEARAPPKRSWPLRQALADAEQALHAAEDASGKTRRTCNASTRTPSTRPCAP